MPATKSAFVLWRLAWIVCCFAPVACSQTVRPISDVEVDGITRTTARITWKSDRASAYQILYGETTSYGMVMKTFILVSNGHYSAFLSGLRPGTTYNFCPQTLDGERSPCDGQRNNFRFTTKSGDMQDPEPPRDTPEIGQPELTGEVFPVRPDCSDLQEQLNRAARANADLNHEVRIPAGAVCSGRFTLPNRTGPAQASGWITVRPDISDDELPPQGMAINPSYASRLPVIQSNYVSVYFFPAAPGSCVGGDFWWESDEKDWKLFRCADPQGPRWEPIPLAASGTSVPEACEIGDWFFKTDEQDRHKQAWWCLYPNRYVNVYLDNGGYLPEFAALLAERNAHHYRVQGVQITHVPLPQSYAELFNSRGARKKGALSGCLAMTPPTSHHITYDRVWFRGQGYPSGLWYGFCMWDGAYQAIINSHFSEINRWVHPDSTEDDSRAINVEQGPGPGRIDNNTFANVVGITLFFSDDLGQNAPVAADYTIRRNRFLLSDAYNKLSPASNGRHYYRRHHLELKRGVRFLVEGNIFDGGWAGTNLGASVVLTPRPGGGNNPQNQIGITDFSFQNNVLRNAPEGFLIIGHNDGGTHQTLTTQRINISNNLVLGLSGRRSGWPPYRKGTGQFINMGLGIEDLKIHHNTIFNSEGDCCTPNFLSHGWDEPNGGLDVRFNIFTFNHRDTRVGVWLGGSYEGTEALDRLWKAGTRPQYTFTNNVLFRPNGQNDIYPRGNYFVENVNAIGFNEQLQLTDNSPYKAGRGRAASDGKDMGVDMTQLKKAVQAVERVQLVESQANRAVIAYQFLNNDPNVYCAVDVSGNELFFPFNRFWDNGQGEDRLVELTGLEPATNYFLRLQCGTSALIYSLFTEAAPAAPTSNHSPFSGISGGKGFVRSGSVTAAASGSGHRKLRPLSEATFPEIALPNQAKKGKSRK